MIDIRYTCGHTATMSDMAAAAPVCSCGERQIVMVHPRRLPRFVGTVTGPYAEFKALDPGTVNVAPGGSLKIKEQD